MKLRRLLKRLALVLALAKSQGPLQAGGLYSQLVLPFDGPRSFTQTYLKGEHALVLEFRNTAPRELAALEHYDERLIKRVIIKDLSPAGTEVKLVLRDRNVRAMVNTFKEPFRVTVDLFDAHYEEERDLTTGLPVVTPHQEAPDAEVAAAPTSRSRLLVPEDGETPPAAGPASATAVAPTPTAPPGGKRRLLQPMPDLFVTPEELEAALKGAVEGVGKSWRDYPPYVYRLQTAAHEEAAKKEPPPAAIKALSSAEAMADYAGKLFAYGQEAKALLAYQQVLHKDPSLFDKNALHLWKFAEVHLGQGNLTLARGYYEALVEKHPESALSNFARLRILDVSAIRMLQQDRPMDLPSLVDKLGTIKPRQNGELLAQLALRRAYWNAGGATLAKDYRRLPPIDPPVARELGAAYPHVEGSRTAFLAASLLLADMARPDTPWQRSTGPFADGYFKRFSGEPTEPYRKDLSEALYLKLNRSLQTKATEGKLVEAIDDYEALPQSMRSVRKNPKTAWALAESYRKLGQTEMAADLYVEAARLDAGSPDRFKAEFWLAVTAGEVAAQLAKSGGGQSRVSRYRQLSRDADRKMETTWASLKEEERAALTVAYKDHFEKTVTGEAKLRTPPRIVLAGWTKGLTTKASATTGAAQGAGELAQGYSPSGAAVILLSDLGRRFAELGLPKERREAIGLLKHMKPSEFDDDKAAKTLWANQLVELADDYRKANQYLDAGRLYGLVGGASENWERRAESLYKGGLLLFRAGRREEALEAFRKAADDGNNLFYANLAKERLAQLE